MQISLFDQRPSDRPTSSSLLAGLNEAQRQAAVTVDGPVLVIAGAGSGKTRTLIYRLAYLVEQGVAPENILLLTFTRKAAQEMLVRAAGLLDDSCQRVVGGTFHAVGNLLLRRYGRVLGYGSQFTIIDRGDAESIVNLLKSSLGFGGAGRRFPSKKVLVDIISRTVNRGLSLEEIVLEMYGHLADYLDPIQTIARHYQEFKKEQDLMDYDDLLVNWQRLLIEDEEVKNRICGRFSHILVDEYQDTNLIQANIVRRLAATHDNVMAVGDDGQSIYSFRGADFRNIMAFPRLFPGTRIIRLEENYRSTNAILTLANAVMDNAAERYEKNLFTNIAGGQPPVLYAARDENAQARYVADQLQVLHQQQGIAYGEMAVLFRSGFHSFKLEMELTSRGIAFEKRGGMKLTESAHIKDVLSYLRLLHNPEDSLSWSRVLLLLDKIGPKTAHKITSWLRAQEDPIAAMPQYPGTGKWRPGYQELAAMLAQARQQELPVEQFTVIMSYYQQLFETLYHDDYPRRAKDLEQLQSIIGGYEKLAAFIDDITLDPVESDSGGADNDDKLVLTTIHSAKGLEWQAVFVIHLADGKFPAAQAAFSEQLEEERRLFYVAITRARNYLYLCYPRMVGGHDRQLAYAQMSPLLEEIPHTLLRNGEGMARQGVAVPSPAGKTMTSPGRAQGRPTLTAGMTVRHGFFGQGRVDRVVSATTVEVFFPRHGRKTLHLDYAKLERIEG